MGVIFSSIFTRLWTCAALVALYRNLSMKCWMRAISSSCRFFCPRSAAIRASLSTRYSE